MRSRIAHPARRAPVLAFAAVLILCAGPQASAQPAPAIPPEAPAQAVPKLVYRAPHVHVWTRLEYERKPGAEACLDENAFRLMTGDEEDPFTPDPQGVDAGKIRIVLSTSPEGFVARYVWTGSPDVIVPEDRIVVAGHAWRQCFEALSALALAVTIQHAVLQRTYAKKYAPKLRDRLLAACPAPKAEPVVTPPACFESPHAIWPRKEAPIPPEYDPPKPVERWPVALRLGLAGWPEAVAEGVASFGISAELGARYRFVSLGVEAHVDPSLGTAGSAAEGPVSFVRVSGALLPCVHAGIFAACGVADVGRFLFPNHIQVLPAWALYSAVGVRVKVEIPAAPPWLFIQPSMDLRAPVGAKPYRNDKTILFQPAAPGFGFGAGLLFELPPPRF